MGPWRGQELPRVHPPCGHFLQGTDACHLEVSFNSQQSPGPTWRLEMGMPAAGWDTPGDLGSFRGLLLEWILRGHLEC